MIVPASDQAHIQAGEIIRRGGVIAFRTDTFYALGADPSNSSAVRKVAELKGREGKPILILVSDPDLVQKYLRQTLDLFDRLAKHFWPGPLTLIGSAAEELPDELTAGTGTLGVRVPNDEAARVLLRACGGALTATSANPTGEKPGRSASEVARYFSNGLDLIVDGGEVNATAPSTVIDLSV
ncbi:MAG: L-threonylcarbamoyladenylate synthase, partial [Acidobacteriota bacterium]|nr:L-threonylcarbamoyladenylate synthase [Acidobacteriota bacterium]